MTLPMDGKVALVTGGGTGIGKAIALAFADAGADVVIAGSRNVEAGAEVVRQIEGRGRKALFVQTDVSQSDQVATLVEKTLKHFGRLDYACNNAGFGGQPTSIIETDEAIWDQIIDVNLKGVWLCMKHEIPAMLEHGGGTIVNIASVGGLIGTPGLGAYTASKHGVVGLTKSAALEFAKAGIRVNAVCPGVIRTDMFEFGTRDNPAFGQMLEALHPIGRVGTVDEVASAVLWLCSEGAGFVTGAAITVDGGVTAQ